MTTLSINLPTTLAKASQEAAMNLGISRTQFIRQAITHEIAHYQAKLEEEAASRNPQGDLFSTNTKEPEPPTHPALEALRQIDPDALSPKDALELLYRLQKLSG